MGPQGQFQQSSHGHTSTMDALDADYKALLKLEADLLTEEEKLKREIAYMNQHKSPWSRPRQIREPRKEPPPNAIRREQRWLKECPSGPSSRSNSRASSTRSNTEADLMEKATKLLQDAEEMERKPIKKQQVLIEDNVVSGRRSISPQSDGNIQRTIIKVPNNEVDNRSPLPFSYDNFSTLGVRGNIASVGAAEPDTPYPPIFPTIKKSPSPARI